MTTNTPDPSIPPLEMERIEKEAREYAQNLHVNFEDGRVITIAGIEAGKREYLRSLQREEWIPASVIPKEGYYIVSAPGAVGIDVAYFDMEDWIRRDRDIDGKREKITDYVLYYQPLPSPPKTTTP
jgi:hypothetical protein